MASLGSVSFSAAQSRLHLDLFHDGNFEVQLDGIRYTAYSGGVDIGGLAPGTHSIRVVEVFRGRAYRGRGRSVLYNGSINIPFRSAVFARLNPNNQLRVTEVRSIAPPPVVRKPAPTRGGQGYRRGHGSSRGNGAGRGPAVNAFELTRTQIIHTPMDRDKLALATQYVSSGRVTSSEVASLMNLLTFEKNKLALAKQAYANTIDKQNYHLVNSSFTFDSSVRELNRFIIGHRTAPTNRRGK